MSILTKKKSESSFPRKLDNTFLDKIIKFVDSDTKNIKFLKVEVLDRCEDPNPPSIYDNDDDFKGDYLGEVQLTLNETSLKDCEKIVYKDNDDLFKKVVSFILQSTKNHMEIEKDDPIRICIDRASDYLYSKNSRGEVTTLLCNKSFKENHSKEGWPSCEETVIITDDLPDNVAIGLYQRENINYDITILGFINRKKKWLKLKLLSDNIVICSEAE